VICYDRPVLRLFLLLLAPCLFGSGPFYLGSWKIESAVVAPWWTDHEKPDAVEMKSLVAKTVVIGVRSIRGPGVLACADPRYQVKDYPAEMLFQGAFGEMRERDRAVDPAKVAQSLGFRGANWKTLETGCANQIDWHFLDSDTMMFALNNYIYKLRKRR
jgi:hypothetical protein